MLDRHKSRGGSQPLDWEVVEGREGMGRRSTDRGKAPSARSELMGGRERVRPARRGPRTADEIKEAYGRPVAKKYGPLSCFSGKLSQSHK